MFKKSLFVGFIFVIFSLKTAFSQGLINGTVVDVIDGRTLVVSNSVGNNINVRLRYLEIPEPEQQLSDVVKNHLKDLALGKKIAVTKVQIFSNYTLGVGMITEKNVNFDLSQQMIRDGAGWFDVYDASIVTDQSTSDYQETEQLAKNEKRGVWGIAGMKTPWEFRNEKLLKRAEELSLSEMVKNSSKSTNGMGKLAIFDFEFKTPKPVAETTNNLTDNKTSNVTANNLNNDLTQVYYAQFNKGGTVTKPFDFSIQNGKVTQNFKLMFGYNYSIENSNKNITKLGLLVLAKIERIAFLKGKNVSIILDNGKKVDLGIGRYDSNKQIEGIQFENVDRTEILSILASNSVTLVIGKYRKEIPDSYKQTINNFVNTLK
jgi:endonuclease YncB( thermonuclease family)